MDLLGKNAPLIERSLDLASLRQRVIAQNIANVNTPGYRAKTVHFDEELAEAVLREREGVLVREDGNSVVMEIEVGEMRKNALAYQVLMSALGHDVRQIRSAITGGR